MSTDREPRPSSLALLTIDAMTEFERVVDAVPAPGRGGAIGRLNPTWVTVLHVTRIADVLRALATGSEPDSWLAGRRGDASPPDWEELREALARTRERLSSYCATATDAQLAQLPPEPLPALQLPPWLSGTPLQPLVARVAAHTFAHAGELSALASLVGAPDLGLPGTMPASAGETQSPS